MLFKIGELAKRAGLTIRALRHYDEIGLLVPSTRMDSGYRLYDHKDVATLYRIQALRRLDLSLDEIKAILANGSAALPDVITQQISFLGRQIQQASALQNHLIELQRQLALRQEPAIDDWLVALENMVAGTKYFTDEELKKFRVQRDAVSPATESEKAQLSTTLRDFIRHGIPADHADVQQAALRWIELLLDEVGGDEGLLIKFYAMHWNEPALQALSGIDQTVMTYISHAMAYRRIEIYAKYCQPEEIQSLRRHYVAQVNAWPPLIASVRECMAQGVAPESPEIRALVQQWLALSDAKTGGDPGLQIKLQTAFENEPAIRFGSGIDAPLLAYIRVAIGKLKTAERSNHQEEIE